MRPRRRPNRTPTLLSWQPPGPVRAAVLILPGGVLNSHGRYWKVFDVALRRLARQMADRGRAAGLAVHLLRYRYRGWNGDDADTATDARWALSELERRYGDVPVALVGNSLGATAAFWVADHPRVASVVGIAPWLPGDEPVRAVAGRKVLILHGDRDHRVAPARLSLRYAHQARSIVPDLARFEVAGGDHTLLCRLADAWAAVTNFVLGTVAGHRLAAPIASAMSAPGRFGLRAALPAGFAW